MYYPSSIIWVWVGNWVFDSRYYKVMAKMKVIIDSERIEALTEKWKEICNMPNLPIALSLKLMDVGLLLLSLDPEIVEE